jgi:hypothetical protein
VDTILPPHEQRAARSTPARSTPRTHTTRLSPPTLSHRAERALLITAIVLGALGVLLAIASVVVEEPLRHKLEQQLNAKLKGYHATIGRVDLHPLRLGWELDDVTLTQQAKPNPPVAHVGEIEATIQFRALLHGALVADIAIRRPTVHLTLDQVRAEVNDQTPVDARGWQDAVEALHPAKINAFNVYDGDFTYVDESKFPPIHVSKAHLLAENIRNVRSRAGVLPSPIHLDAYLFDTATVRFDGDADMLATPKAAVDGDFHLVGFPLEPLETMAHHYGITLHGGTLDADGHVASKPDGTADVLVRDGVVRQPQLDVQNDAAGSEEVAHAGNVATEAATRAGPMPVTVRVAQFRVVDGSVSMSHGSSKPPWTVFVTDLDVGVQGFSTRKGDPPGHAQVRGKLMGTGSMDIETRVTPPTKGPDFQAKVSIENVELRTMNDLLRATGNFDVARGTMSFWSDVTVKDGHIEGYAKPFFSDLQVYDPQQDKDKGVLHNAWEHIVGGVADVFTSPPTNAVATETNLSGPVKNPQASTWEIVVRLVQNAFFKAILPGLDPTHH